MSELILIADDDEDVASAVEVNLQLEGYEVHLAHDGIEALEQARKLQPDLILLDVVMPGLDGFEVCRRLRADPRTMNSAVILLTAAAVAAMLVFFGRTAQRHPLLSVSLGLVIGGSIANLIDRVRLGHVTDFLDFHWHGYSWPAFNVADSCITTGMLILLVHSLLVRDAPESDRV